MGWLNINYNLRFTYFILFFPLIKLAGEEELVNSGLEETMITSFKEVLETSQNKQTNMRTAAYVVALSKVANTYLDLGL